MAASPSSVFALLRDPGRHQSFDGSGMLRGLDHDGGTAGAPVSAVGDAFVMRMHHTDMGDYEMTNRVVDYVPDRRIIWEPMMTAAAKAELQDTIGTPPGYRWGYELEPDGPDATTVTEIFDCSRSPAGLRAAVDEGRAWLPAMTASLERLEELARRSPVEGRCG